MPKEPEHLTKRLFDDSTVKIIDHSEKIPGAKSIRSSQILTGIFGILGFSLFLTGLEKLFIKFQPIALVATGIFFMLLAGVFLKKLTDKE